MEVNFFSSAKFPVILKKFSEKFEKVMFSLFFNVLFDALHRLSTLD